MKLLTLYRSDFRDHEDDKESMFLSVLSELGIEEGENDYVDSITLKIDEVTEIQRESL